MLQDWRAYVKIKKEKKKKNMRWPEDKPFPKGAALFKK
jgi:hypothetical protein